MDTSIFSNLNWLHILVATVAYFAFGAIWYAPLFGKTWARLHKVSMDDDGDAMKGFAAIMATGFVTTFFVTTALAILVSRLQLTEVLSGIKLGAFTGLFFSAAAISITYLYLRKPIGLHLIEGGYHVIGQMIAASILVAWQ